MYNKKIDKKIVTINQTYKDDIPKKVCSPEFKDGCLDTFRDDK